MNLDNVNVQWLHDALNHNGYICSPSFSAKLTTAVKTKPVGGAFLHGMAGTGKSYLPHVLSTILSRPLYSYQCTNRTQPEDLLSKPMPDDKTKSGMSIMPGVLLEASQMSHEEPVVLMLDEWDKTRPNADGFFLDFLQYGKLSIPGMSVQANLDNMLIFFTANDDRTFHEALLRRFPKMDIKPMKPKTVLDALSMTHDGHPYMSSMIDLYCRSISGNLPKPATIQELRQLMDAITVLGDGADWNTLVYQYVTKTPEAHDILSNTPQVDSDKYDADNEEVAVIDADNYGITINDENGNEVLSNMPKISFDMPTVGNNNVVEVPKEEIFGVFERNDRIAGQIMAMNIEDGVDQDDCVSTDWYELTKDLVYLKHPYRVTDIHYIQRFYRTHESDGEIKLYDTYVTRKEISRLLRGKGWYIHKRDKYEIIARRNLRGHTVDLRYADGEGMEVIMPAKLNLKAELFKFNNDEHLSHCLPLLHEMNDTETIARPNDMFEPSKIVGGDLKDVLSNRLFDRYGSSVIKSLSEHTDSYCNMTLLKTPTGAKYAADKEFIDTPIFAFLTPDINPYGDANLVLKGKNVEIKLSDHFHTNGSVSLKITGPVDGDVLAELYRWIRKIPIYKCFRHNGKLFQELLDEGWEIGQTMQTLYNGDMQARFVYDYVIFVTFVRYRSDESTTEMLLQTQINRIQHLEEQYNIDKDK